MQGVEDRLRIATQLFIYLETDFLEFVNRGSDTVMKRLLIFSLKSCRRRFLWWEFKVKENWGCGLFKSVMKNRRNTPQTPTHSPLHAAISEIKKRSHAEKILLKMTPNDMQVLEQLYLLLFIYLF